MTRTSYALNAKHLGYFFLIMFLVMFMIVIMLYAAVTANAELVYLSFLLISIIAAIVMVIVLWQKSEFGHKRIDDYSLKNK